METRSLTLFHSCSHPSFHFLGVQFERHALEAITVLFILVRSGLSICLFVCFIFRFTSRGQKSLPVGSVCAAATVVKAGALDVGTVGLFVLSCCSSFGDDTLCGAVMGVETVFDGAGVGVAAKVEVVIAVVASLAVLVGEVRAAVGLVPVASALRVGVL